MKKTKFTPWPWEIDDRGYGYAIEPSVCWIGENSSTTPEQLKANAHLILAAPEMYAELETLRKFLLQNRYEFAASLVDDVLRKARGESEVENG